MSADRQATTSALAPEVDWHRIDTVLLDMDGTLLDLNYDNLIWNQVVPLRVAQRAFDTSSPTQEQIESAARPLIDQMLEHRGRLEFYDLHYWGERAELDMVALHHEFAEHIDYRPGAKSFLEALAGSEKQVVLATNAHRDCLGVKHRHAGLLDYFDAVISSHDYGAPKEEQQFWQALQRTHPFDPARTLFIDDNQQVLAAARKFGIGLLLCVVQPDLHRPPQAIHDYAAVDDLSTLLPLSSGASR